MCGMWYGMLYGMWLSRWVCPSNKKTQSNHTNICNQWSNQSNPSNHWINNNKNQPLKSIDHINRITQTANQTSQINPSTNQIRSNQIKPITVRAATILGQKQASHRSTIVLDRVISYHRLTYPLPAPPSSWYLWYVGCGMVCGFPGGHVLDDRFVYGWAFSRRCPPRWRGDLYPSRFIATVSHTCTLLYWCCIIVNLFISHFGTIIGMLLLV